MQILVIKPHSAMDPMLVKQLDTARRYASLAHINNINLHGVKVFEDMSAAYKYAVEGSVVTYALTKWDIEKEFQFQFMQSPNYKRFLETKGVMVQGNVFNKQFTTWNVMDKHIYMHDEIQSAWEHWFPQYYFENFESIYNEKP